MGVTPAFTWVAQDLRALDEVQGEVLVLTTFSNERPLRGLTGLVDWRLCGGLSRLLLAGFASGAVGERVLCPSRGRMSHPKVLLMGLGPRAEHRTDRALAVAGDAAETVQGLGASSMTCGLFGLEHLASPLDRGTRELTALLASFPGLREIVLVSDTPEAGAR